MAKNINTENTGAWKASKYRQTSARDGPAPIAIIGSMALDRVIGAAQCCPRVILPNPPVGLSAIPSVGTATIYFTPGYDYDIDPVTNYAYSLDGIQFTTFAPPQGKSPVIITGLTNGVTYRIFLASVNRSGLSIPSVPISVMPTLLAKPVPILALPANKGLYIYFEPSNGEVSPTNYQWSVDGGETFTVANPPTTASPIFIPNLSNGVAYSVQLMSLTAIYRSQLSLPITGTPTANVNPTSPTINIDPTVYSGSGPVIAAPGISGTRQNVAWITDPDGGFRLFYFTFPGSYISFPSYNFGQAITVTAWIEPRSTTNAYQFSVLLGATNFSIGWNTNALGAPPSKSLLLQGSGTETDSSDNVVTYGTWQHVGYVFDPVGATILCFVNGIPTWMNNGIATAPNIQTAAPFYIGAQTDGTNSMTASLGYVRAYGYRFTQTDMFSEYVMTKGRFGL